MGKDFVNKPSRAVFILSSPYQEWTQGVSLPTTMYGNSCAVLGSKIYVMGGLKNSHTLIDQVYTLDTSAPGSSWELGPELPTHQRYSQAFVYHRKLYLVAHMYQTGEVLSLGPGDKSWTV